MKNRSINRVFTQPGSIPVRATPRQASRLLLHSRTWPLCDTMERTAIDSVSEQIHDFSALLAEDMPEADDEE